MQDVLSLVLADATTPPAGAEAGLLGYLPLIVIFVLMWFLMIRPQMKRQKELRELISNLSKGDEVIAAAGLIGRITKIEGDYLVLAVSNLDSDKPAEILVQKASVSAVLAKGTIKDLL
ncbi:preprotein translocase subunit YajC [Basilea psittacipulmonis]|uniref:Sec translocon accessory complex subunit YajC n=1 Tax=Basilea psittacipulmonis DSM 24701 TaxID=1072685 RepID=A0A077DDU4_9BURK|nr:preprotein translocase subunit YajC [Basilea psittacipulmonis]AIL33040.1 preprotein translocase subunit YajC [Basilea psittacipulmonis DSM 24701]